MYALLLEHRLTGHRSLKVHEVLAFAGLLHRSQGCLRSACQRDLEKHKERKVETSRSQAESGAMPVLPPEGGELTEDTVLPLCFSDFQTFAKGIFYK